MAKKTVSYEDPAFPGFRMNISENVEKGYTDFYIQTSKFDAISKTNKWENIGVDVCGILTRKMGKKDYSPNHYNGAVTADCNLIISLYWDDDKRKGEVEESFRVTGEICTKIEGLLNAYFESKAGASKKRDPVKIHNCFKVASSEDTEDEYTSFKVRTKKKYYGSSAPADALSFVLENPITINGNRVTGITRGDLWDVLKPNPWFVICNAELRARYLKSKKECSIYTADPALVFRSVVFSGRRDTQTAAASAEDKMQKMFAIPSEMPDDDDGAGGMDAADL